MDRTKERMYETDWIEYVLKWFNKKCLAMSPSLHPNVTFITPFSYAILYHVEEGQESISKRWCFSLSSLTGGRMTIN